MGGDGVLGWSYWSAPFKLEDGLIDESLPESEWSNAGVQLPVPGGTRYIQFRVYFDGPQHGAALLDFIEFDYDTPLVSGGVVAEIFPPGVPLGEETLFRYYLRPLFEPGDPMVFNRIEIDVPSLDSRIDTLRVDGLDWVEIGAGSGGDPLLDTDPARLAPAPGSADSLGQFAQSVVTDPATGLPRLSIKLPPMGEEHFRFDQTIEVVFRSRLFQGSKQFLSSLWNDRVGPGEAIPQPTEDGDATPDVATNSRLVVVDDIGSVVEAPRVAPNPFTPNGDGINDEAVFSFDVFLLMEEAEVEFEIYDLSGRSLVRFEAGDRAAGALEFTWDGRDQHGQPVPPGIYLYRFAVDSDDTAARHSGVLSVAY